MTFTLSEPSVEDPTSLELLIREARRATRRRRRRAGALALLVLAVVAAALYVGATNGPARSTTSPVSARVRPPVAVASALAHTAQRACGAGLTALPLPYALISRGTAVHAFFPSSTSDGHRTVGPYDCQFLLSPRGRATVFGPGVGPILSKGAHVGAKIVLTLDAGVFGGQGRVAATNTAWASGRVAASVRKVAVWLSVNNNMTDVSTASTRLLNGGFFAYVVPANDSALSVNQILVVAYGAKDRYLGTSICRIAPTFAGVEDFENCSFVRTPFLY